MLRVALWNLLADGLSEGEFITPNGDKDTNWTSRKDSLVDVLSQMMNNSDLIGTVENDHPAWILSQLRLKTGLNIRAITYVEMDNDCKPKVTMCRKLHSLREKKENTFEPENLSIMHSLYGKNNSDSYVCDLTNTIYYNNDTVKLIRSDDEHLFYSQENHLLLGSKQCWTRCKFKHVELNTKFTVHIAHLPSGESYEREQIRVNIIDDIFQSTKKVNNSDDISERFNQIILMDSNSSDLYESEYHNDSLKIFDTVSKNIVYYGFNNLIPVTGNECFKMRHAQGDQPSKFGHLMYDTIDKILIPNPLEGKQFIMNWDWFPKVNHDFIKECRCNPSKRGLILQHCVNMNNIRKIDNYEGVQVKDKDAILFMMDSCPNNRWGNSTETIDYKQLSFDLECSEELLREMFKSIYPNKKAPSDHPALLAHVRLL